MGIYIDLIEDEIIDRKKEEILIHGKRIVDVLIDKEETQEAIEYISAIGGVDESAYGLAYASRKSKYFIEIENYIIKRVQKKTINQREKILKEIFENITDKTLYNCYTILESTTPDKKTTYRYTAIFEGLDGLKIATSIKSLKNDSIRSFKSFIHNRYSTVENYHKADIHCLRDMSKSLGKYEKQDYPIKNKMIKILTKELNEIIVKLE